MVLLAAGSYRLGISLPPYLHGMGTSCSAFTQRLGQKPGKVAMGGERVNVVCRAKADVIPKRLTFGAEF